MIGEKEGESIGKGGEGSASAVLFTLHTGSCPTSLSSPPKFPSCFLGIDPCQACNNKQPGERADGLPPDRGDLSLLGLLPAETATTAAHRIGQMVYWPLLLIVSAGCFCS